MNEPKFAIVPLSDWDGALNATKEQLNDYTPIQSGELEGKIRAITAKPLKVKDGRYLFQSNRRFDEIDSFDFSETENIEGMFSGATLLQTLPKSLNVSQSKSAKEFLKGCAAVTTLKDLDLSECENFNSAFMDMTSLQRFENINFGNKEKIFLIYYIILPH